jgi:hypothetical protein
MMKTSFVGLVAGVLLWGAAHGDDGKANAGKIPNEIIGTWEVETPALPEGFRDLKHITPSHFIWVIYRKDEMTPVATAGGTWSLHGDQYTERCEFASPGWEHLRGKEMTFSVKIEQGKLYQKGKLDTGFLVDEVWKRAASPKEKRS